MICTENYLADETEKGMSLEQYIYGRSDSFIQVLMAKTEGKKHMKDLGVDGRSLLICVLKFKW